MAAKKRSTNGAPDGFSEVDNSLSGFWKPTTAGQTLQGIVGHMIETTGAEGKPNRFYAIRITDPAKCHGVLSEDKEIEVNKDDLIGVGGAILLQFLAERAGQEVYMIYKGLGPKKRGKNQAKLYQTFARDFDPETGEVQD